MKKLWVGFSRRSNFNILSKLITLVEKSQFSHAYIRIEVADRTVIYQASGLQVNFQNLAAFDAKETVYAEFEFDVSDEQYAKVMDFCIDNLDKPYGLMELIGVGLMKLFNLKTNPFPGNSDKFICVKLAAAVAEQLGLETTENLDAMDLNDLFDLLFKAKPKLVKP